jgi:hypothetical protein
LTGDGSGGFSALRILDAGGSAAAYAVGDFNGDGLADIAVTPVGFDFVTVLLSRPNGDFASLKIPGTAGYAMTAADFNGDGVSDLAILTSTGIAILLGGKNGSFSPPMRLAGNYWFGGIQAADVTGDGKPDLIITTATEISVLTGLGDGSFDSAVQVTAVPPVIPTIQYQFAAADFDGDGKTDLALLSSSGFQLFSGNGDGTFRSAGSLPTGAVPVALAAVDWNADGKMDIVVANAGSGTITVALNQSY